MLRIGEVSDSTYHKHSTPTSGEVCVGLCAEDAQNVVVLVDCLTVVTALLRVPPVCVWVTELALYGEGRSQSGIGVVAVL